MTGIIDYSKVVKWSLDCEDDTVTIFYAEGSTSVTWKEFEKMEEV